MTTHEYKLKCTNCGLHYTTLSWEPGWDEKHGGGYCPECGIKGAKIAWQDTTNFQIFEIVPGVSHSKPMTMYEAEKSTFALGQAITKNDEAGA